MSRLPTPRPSAALGEPAEVAAEFALAEDGESVVATVSARRVGVRQLECASPPSASSGSRRLALSANAQQFGQSDAAFTYRPLPSVSS